MSLFGWIGIGLGALFLIAVVIGIWNYPDDNSF
jgi:hypothetical protein